MEEITNKGRSGVTKKGDRVNLPRFDAHSLTGTIVPEESNDDQENEKDLQSGIQAGSGAVIGRKRQGIRPVGAGIGRAAQPTV